MLRITSFPTTFSNFLLFTPILAVVYLFYVLPWMAPLTGDWDEPRKTFVAETAFPRPSPLFSAQPPHPSPIVREDGEVRVGVGSVDGAFFELCPRDAAMQRVARSVFDVVTKSFWRAYTVVVDGRKGEKEAWGPATVPGVVDPLIARRMPLWGAELESHGSEGSGGVWVDGRKWVGEVDSDVFEMTRETMRRAAQTSGVMVKKSACWGGKGEVGAGGWEMLAKWLGVKGRGLMLGRAADEAIRRIFQGIASGDGVGDVVRVCGSGEGWKEVVLGGVSGAIRAHNHLEERAHAGTKHWTLLGRDSTKRGLYFVTEGELWFVVALLWIPACAVAATPHFHLLLPFLASSILTILLAQLLPFKLLLLTTFTTSLLTSYLLTTLPLPVTPFVHRWNVDGVGKSKRKDVRGEEGEWGDDRIIDEMTDAATQAIAEAFTEVAESIANDDGRGDDDREYNNIMGLPSASFPKPDLATPPPLRKSHPQPKPNPPFYTHIIVALSTTYIHIGLVAVALTAIDPLATIGFFANFPFL